MLICACTEPEQDAWLAVVGPEELHNIQLRQNTTLLQLHLGGMGKTPNFDSSLQNVTPLYHARVFNLSCCMQRCREHAKKLCSWHVPSIASHHYVHGFWTPCDNSRAACHSVFWLVASFCFNVPTVAQACGIRDEPTCRPMPLGSPVVKALDSKPSF